jgi:hypothetical protein
MTPTPFDVFSPKALAGIGRLPDTLADRSLQIRMRRKTRGESVERFRLKTSPAEAEEIRDKLTEWAKHSKPALKLAEPFLPESLDDRAQDVSEPLFAIAELAGDEWQMRARAAIIEVRLGSPDADGDIGVELLADIRLAFAEDNTDRLSTAELISRLCRDPERQWATFLRGADRMTPRRYRTCCATSESTRGRSEQLSERRRRGTCTSSLRTRSSATWTAKLPNPSFQAPQRHNPATMRVCAPNPVATPPTLWRIEMSRFPLNQAIVALLRIGMANRRTSPKSPRYWTRTAVVLGIPTSPSPGASNARQQPRHEQTPAERRRRAAPTPESVLRLRPGFRFSSCL